ncbi:hypothetical protein [Ureibacillus aquaedulcis]|uniref:DUF4190 domain-containing protein n=1 Tax=Ureibacillus aquaedulcis TaxID=3058421 RepID=A0ABT8GLE6_9BACL|nr:hypothetical protein [Ureibacillus sp. BA0131]MDN4492230.1 hypothetical protein [Ureibacillus sp. BA0131]
MAVTLKWVSGGLEALLGIPLIGGTIIIALAYFPLLVMLIIHIATLIVCKREGKSRVGSIVGIVTNLVAWIPFLGMAMHIITAVILLLSAYQDKKRSSFS